MSGFQHDSHHDRLVRYSRLRALLTAESGGGARRAKPRLGWLAITGIFTSILVLFASVLGLAPVRAGASAKTQSALSLSVAKTAPVSRVQSPFQGAAVQPAPPMIALVIDDIGPARQWSEQALALPMPVTLAVLPYVHDAPQWVARAKAAGHDVLLHMPMEPYGLQNPGPGALLRSLSGADNRARLSAALLRVPGVIGVNNHMGSRFTACARCVADVADILQDRGLMFLDSMTSPASAAATSIGNAGVPVIKRDVFLDDINTPQAIVAQMRRAEKLSRINGIVVVIAHPRPNSIRALQKWVIRLEKQGVKMISLRVALARKQEQERGDLLRSAGL